MILAPRAARSRYGDNGRNTTRSHACNAATRRERANVQLVRDEELAKLLQARGERSGGRAGDGIAKLVLHPRPPSNNCLKPAPGAILRPIGVADWCGCRRRPDDLILIVRYCLPDPD